MRIALIATCLLALVSGAQAKHHHQSHHRIHYVQKHQVRQLQQNYGAPTGGGSLVEAMGRYLGGNPTGWAHNWCGEFVGMVVKQLGGTPPRDYPLAAAWRNYGHDAGGPAPGVVMVMSHHVGVVIANLGGGRVLVRSGNHGHRVGDGVYDTRRAIAWRTA
jgi:uncharacterized protein (TIGR02594 family)